MSECCVPSPLWPFPVDALRKTLGTAKHYLTVEMSTGQMVDDVRLAINGECPVHFYGRTGGMVPTVSEVINEIRKYAAPAPEVTAERALNEVIDEKFQSVTDAVSRILERTRKTFTVPAGSQQPKTNRP